MNRQPEMDPDYQAELEDRAAELVERDYLLGHARRDNAEARAQLAADDRATLTKRATEWEDLCDRSGGHRDDSWWRGVL